jgi:Zn-dependent peptidase ImmA (M78 family)/DNA-binding XRE family transcriptional regulator
MLGKRLNELRKALDINQKQVASLLSVTQETISKIENEKRSLSSFEVFKLSKALDIPIGYFFGEIELNQLGQIYFRASSSLNDIDKAKIPILKRLANNMYDIEEVLKNEVKGIARNYKVENNRIEDIRRIAIEERRLLGFDDLEPIKNLERLLTSYNIKVLTPVLDFAINGLFIALSNDRYLIAINSDNPPSRRNFTLGHEYGHYLMHRSGSFQAICTGLENPDKLSGYEKMANIFSAEFLMPIKSFNRFTRNEEAFALYLHKYGVSREALVYRLVNLGLINQEQKEYFQNQFKPIEILLRLKLFPEETGWYSTSKKNRKLMPKERQKRKQLNLSDLISNDYKATVFQAYERGLITYTKAAEYLFLNETQLNGIIPRKELSYEF